MSPGFVDSLNANSSSNITRFNVDTAAKPKRESWIQRDVDTCAPGSKDEAVRTIYSLHEWCNSPKADELRDDDWDGKFRSLKRCRLQVSIVHWHAVATSSTNEWVILHNRVAETNGLWTKVNASRNVKLLTCNRPCEKSQGNRPIMKENGSSSVYGMITYDVMSGATPPALHMHDVGPNTVVAVTGMVRSGSMTPAEIECIGHSYYELPEVHLIKLCCVI
ncbi:hypothetical protein IV203_026631 [Nitzschia inconspicua]|uniref:Uncharacterized protein n=1 Tax=Nitzschia inconspicua TaxID=303405 RepID=A0A9K3LMM7_9STRA|nr:hypothetical protein IV203_026631 [Nitzschia inconspicua]